MNAAQYFYYSLLRYCDLRREESFVIGVLIIFPQDHTLRFLHPEHLERLQAAFPGAPLQTIRSYFKGFNLRADQFSDPSVAFPGSATEAAAFIARHFLTEDSSALQFSEPRTVAPVQINQTRIARNFYERYLEIYEIAAPAVAT
jgi:Protein of unknown function (DUF3037)